MNRKELEKRIVKELTPSIEELGYKLYQEDYSCKYNHHIIFIKNFDDLIYRYELTFMKPNFLKVQSIFTVFSVNVNTVLNNFMPKNQEFGVPIINFYVEKYFKKVGIYETDDFYIYDEDYSEIAKKIYNQYFLMIESEIMLSIYSICAINVLLNSKDTFDSKGVMNYSDLCWPIQFQIIGGIMSAYICSKIDFDNFLPKYINFVKMKFYDGEDEYMDGILGFLKENNFIQ